MVWIAGLLLGEDFPRFLSYPLTLAQFTISALVLPTPTAPHEPEFSLCARVSNSFAELTAGLADPRRQLEQSPARQQEQ